MADTQANQIILRVALDEGKSQEQLQKLVLEIEATRKAQTELTAARKAGRVGDEAYAQQTVALRTGLTGQQQAQASITKDLALYRTAVAGVGDSYKGTQAALSLAIRQQQELAGSAGNTSAASQALSKQIEAYRATLAATDAQQGSFFRNVGNYPKGEALEPLIQQLVHLQEVQKTLPAGSEQAVKAEQQIGFQFAKVNQEAAVQGKTMGEVENKLRGYGEAVRPAITNLVQLEKAQDEVAKSAGKESAEFAKIGFQIGATRKEIAAVPPELAKLPPVAERATQALSDTATKGLGLLGEQGERAGGLLDKFRSGTELLREGMGRLKGAGETGALGFKAIASGIALTGMGLFVLAISAVVSYFTQTAEGGRALKTVLGGLGAVVQLATDAFSNFGKTIVEAVKNPKQALTDLVEVLENQVVNRFKAFGLIFNAIRTGDTKQLANGFLQLGTGVENLTTKAGALLDKAKASYALGADFAERERQIAIARRQDAKDDAIAESRVEVLLRLSKERGKSAADQLKALREAGQVEQEMVQGNIALAQKELALVLDQRKVRGAGQKQDLIERQQALELEIIQTETKGREVNARIQVRESVFVEAQRKAAAAAAAQRAKDAVAAKQTENELALLQVAKGSAAELVLKQRALDLAADAALAGEKKTAQQAALIRAEAEGAKLALSREFTAKEVEEAKKRTAATLAEAKRKYAQTQQNLTDYLSEKRVALEQDYARGLLSENQYQKALHALEKAGLAAELVNAKDYGQDAAKIDRARADLEIKEAHRVKDEKKKIEDTKQQIQDASFQAAAAASDATIALFGAESTAGKEALAIKKTLALAEIAISLQKQLVANAEAGTKISAEAPPVTIPLGIAYTVATDALAIATAVGAAAKILGFQQGGVLVGPAHEQGGIPFTVAGRPGFEAEGGETILTKGVWDNPLLRPLASMLNQLGGGAPLLPRTHLAVGGIAQGAYGREQLRGPVQPGVSPAELGAAVARALRQQPPLVRWVDYKQAEHRAAYTEGFSNG